MPLMQSQHDDIADVFLFLGAVVAPAEWHGYICAQLATGQQQNDAQILADALQFVDSQKEPTAEQATVLLEAYRELRREFADGGYAIELLLPDDSYELLQRVEAMADWASGFLSGFAEAKIELNDELEEMINDLTAISQLTVDDEDEDEEAEKAFFEISEYLRMVAASIYAACVGGDGDKPTLH